MTSSLALAEQPELDAALREQQLQEDAPEPLLNMAALRLKLQRGNF